MPISKNKSIHNATYRLGAHLLASWEKPYLNQQAIARILQALIADSEQRTLLAALTHAREESFSLRQLYAIMERFVYDLTLAMQTKELTIDDIGSKWRPFIQALQQILMTDNTIVAMDTVLSGDTPATTQKEAFITYCTQACMDHIQQDDESSIDEEHVQQQLSALLSSPETADKEATENTETITLEDFQQDHAPTLKAKHLHAEIEYLLNPKGTAPANLFNINREALSGDYLIYLNNARIRLETALAQLADLLAETDKPMNMHAINLIEAEIHTITFVIAYRRKYNQLDSEERRQVKPLTEKQKLLKDNILQQLLNKAQDNSMDKLRRMQQQHREQIKACHAKHLQDHDHITKQAALITEQALQLQQQQKQQKEASHAYETRLSAAANNYAALQEQFKQEKEAHATETAQQQQEFEEMQAQYACNLTQKTQQLSEAQDSLVAATADIKHNEQKFLVAQEKLVATLDKLHASEAKLSRRKQAFDELHANFEVLQQDIADMTGSLNKLTEQNKIKVEQLQNRINRLQAELKESQALLAQYERDDQNNEILRQNLNATILQKEAQLTLMKTKLTELRSELSEREQAAADLVKQFQTENEALIQLKHQQRDEIAELKRLEPLLDEKETIINALESQIEKLTAALNEQEAWLITSKETIESDQSTIDELNESLETAELALEPTRKELASLQALYKQGQELVFGLMQQIEMRDSKIKELFTSLDTQTKFLKAFARFSRKLRKENKKLNRQLTATQRLYTLQRHISPPMITRAAKLSKPQPTGSFQCAYHIRETDNMKAIGVAIKAPQTDSQPSMALALELKQTQQQWALSFALQMEQFACVPAILTMKMPQQQVITSSESALATRPQHPPLLAITDRDTIDPRFVTPEKQKTRPVTTPARPQKPKRAAAWKKAAAREHKAQMQTAKEQQVQKAVPPIGTKENAQPILQTKQQIRAALGAGLTRKPKRQPLGLRSNRSRAFANNASAAVSTTKLTF